MQLQQGEHRDGNNEDLSTASLAAANTPRRDASGWSALVEEQHLEEGWHDQLAERLHRSLRGHRFFPGIRSILDEARLTNLRMMTDAGIDFLPSHLHGGGHLDFQGFAVMLGCGSRAHRLAHGILTHGTHAIDDEIDRSGKAGDELRALLHYHRFDFRKFHDEWGEYGKFSVALAELAPSREGYYLGLKRMMYGGLIVHADTPELLDTYLNEYVDLSCIGLSPEVEAVVRRLSKLALSTTSKTVLEIFPLAGGETLEQSHLRSMCFAPAILLSDLQTEIDQHEVPRFGVAPTSNDLVAMIDCATRFHDRFQGSQAVGFIQQLTFIRRAMTPVFPDAVVQAYRRCAEALGRQLSR